ncbi:hypothetical protein [Streptomyces sediminimaris]
MSEARGAAARRVPGRAASAPVSGTGALRTATSSPAAAPTPGGDLAAR